MLHWDGSGTVLGSTQGCTTIRSNNSNLIHNKNGTNYTIYDSGNFTSGTGANNWVAGNDNRLSNARPASDVSSWAKASSKPTYKYAEILAADELVKGDSDVTDNTEIFTSYASNNGFAETADSNAYKGKVYRRDAIKV